jgi:hypothetical protein
MNCQALAGALPQFAEWVVDLAKDPCVRPQLLAVAKPVNLPLPFRSLASPALMALGNVAVMVVSWRAAEG